MNKLKEVLKRISEAEEGKRFVCISEGLIETMTGEARSAEVKEGNVFIAEKEHRSGLGWEGKLQISSGMRFSHVPGFSGNKTDPNARVLPFVVLLRKENVEGSSTFFAQFKPEA